MWEKHVTDEWSSLRDYYKSSRCFRLLSLLNGLDKKGLVETFRTAVQDLFVHCTQYRDSFSALCQTYHFLVRQQTSLLQRKKRLKTFNCVWFRFLTNITYLFTCCQDLLVSRKDNSMCYFLITLLNKVI